MPAKQRHRADAERRPTGSRQYAPELAPRDRKLVAEHQAKHLEQRELAMAEFVEWTGVSGIFEVVEEITI